VEGLNLKKSHKGGIEVDRYETIFIYSPDFPPEKVTSVMERIKSIITQNDGEITSINEWGKRKLAYRILGCSEGVYVYIDHVSSGKAITAVENMFRITEGILRYLTVRKQISKKKPAVEKPEPRKVENPVKEPANPARNPRV
jgi:small subunit ribosomal protein S6